MRTTKGWEYPTDNRGKTIYSIETGEKSIVTDIGDLPANHTLLAPTSDFDSWDGQKWVFDADKQHKYEVEQATIQKAHLIDEAIETISYLQDAIDAEIATEAEKTAFAEWKKYRVLVNRIDVNNAPKIDWPVKPQ